MADRPAIEITGSLSDDAIASLARLLLSVATQDQQPLPPSCGGGEADHNTCRNERRHEKF